MTKSKRTQEPNHHIRPGPGKYWICALGYNCCECSVFCMCQSIPPCANTSGILDTFLFELKKELDPALGCVDWDSIEAVYTRMKEGERK